ncbi:MAG: hypothetical protein WCI61_08790 [Chloroflexota bacterium]
MDVIDHAAGRSVSLDIGPFMDQADLLHFAMLLEAVPELGHIDLIDATPETALFVVRARSAGDLAALLTRLQDFVITATAFGNMVSAQIEDPRKRAAILYSAAPAPTLAAPLPAYAEPAYIATQGPAWWRRAAIAVALGTAAAGLLFFSLNGAPWRTAAVPPVRQTSTTVAVAVPSVVAPAATVAPAAPARPAASATPAIPSATASATPATPTATPAVTPSPTPTATATAIPTSRYTGSFASSFGNIRALNGCAWETPIEGTLAMTLTRASDGSVSGRGTMNGTISYQVTETPEGAICNPTSVTVDASGSATSDGSVSSSMSGTRELAVTFNGTMQGDTVVGDLSIQRLLSTASTFGGTTETRSTTVTGITRAR